VEVYSQLQVGFPRVEAWAKYRKPARQGDLMEVTTWIGQRTRRSLVFHFEMRRDGDPELAAEGGYTVVCVSRPQFRPIPLPPELVELLQGYLPPLTERQDQTASSSSAE
jgi:acyl-CoA thioesterase FadM